MSAIRPLLDPKFPDRMVNPTYPPMFHSNTNGNASPSSHANPISRPPIFPPTFAPPQNPMPPVGPPTVNGYNGNFNPTPPPQFYNQPMATQTPAVRPMYPPPPPPPPPSTAAPATYPAQPMNSFYPQPQYGNQAQPAPSATYSGHPGQPPPFPQPMSYGMGNAAAAAAVTAGPMPTPGNFNPTNMIDLLKEKTVISPYEEELPTSSLPTGDNPQMNCSPEVMRCSLNAIPQTKDLLNKSRLPLGILIHPFKDLESLSVIQGTKIVRCDGCKSYINPFVTFFDNTRWRCSVCSRSNDLPQEFLFDPTTKTYGDPRRRPEVRFGTVEYAATNDYMARPPPPAIYLFLLDVSHNAIQTGYLQSFCDILFENLSSLPGDARTKIGFITFDNHIHFYDLTDRQSGTFRVMVAPDLDNVDNKFDDFLPMPDGLMVNLSECRTMIETFLNELPKIYQNNHQTDSALGIALQIAGKLLHSSGGRVTVVQTRIPNQNPGGLNGQTGKENVIIGPTSDFYKKLALDYASQQIACDLFLLNSHQVDLVTLSGISKYSGGEVKYYPNYHSIQTPHEVERFENDLRRYLQRKIGFEAVMRLRCPPVFSIDTFHGNGFVRSVDLLVLPNINPDAAYGMQLSINETLANYGTVTFQIALLYTSSKGERRIRVHTLSLPVSAKLPEIIANADQEAIVSLIAKMATDRTINSSLQEAREAMCNVAVDIVRASTSNQQSYSLLIPSSLRLIPLYMLSMMKSTAFRSGSSIRLDDRAYYMDLCKTLPTQHLMQVFYPNLYPIHTIEEKSQIIRDGEDEFHVPTRAHLSYQNIDAHGAYILDTWEYIYIFIGKAISDHFVQHVFNVATFSALPMDSYSLPEFENSLSNKIHNFLAYLLESRSNGVGIHIMREDSSHRYLFTRHLIDDKSESSMSYQEFLRYIREQIVK